MGLDANQRLGLGCLLSFTTLFFCFLCLVLGAPLWAVLTQSGRTLLWAPATTGQGLLGLFYALQLLVLGFAIFLLRAYWEDPPAHPCEGEKKPRFSIYGFGFRITGLVIIGFAVSSAYQTLSGWLW